MRKALRNQIPSNDLGGAAIPPIVLNLTIQHILLNCNAVCRALFDQMVVTVTYHKLGGSSDFRISQQGQITSNPFST